jgi:hypothetical protein
MLAREPLQNSVFRITKYRNREWFCWPPSFPLRADIQEKLILKGLAVLEYRQESGPNWNAACSTQDRVDVGQS